MTELAIALGGAILAALAGYLFGNRRYAVRDAERRADALEARDEIEEAIAKESNDALVDRLLGK